jgi:hypothetical protein
MPNPVPKPRVNKKPNKVGISIFLDQKYYNMLKNLAESDDRSISSQGSVIIKSYFDNSLQH